MTLYEINSAILNAGTVDPETGEFTIDPELLAELQLERDTKIENVACWIKNLVAENAAIKAEEQNLAARRKVNENKIESLKKYLGDALGGEKFKTPRCVVSYRSSVSVVVDETHLAKKWMRVSYAPDKTAIKDALKAGTKVRGAALESKTTMQIK